MAEQESLFPSDDGGAFVLPRLWLRDQGPEQDVVVSSRMRLARNVAGFHFKSRFDEGEDERLAGYLRDVLRTAEPGLRYHDLGGLTSTQREVMFERHLVSREHVTDKQPCGVAFNDDGTTSVLINEEDHLRLQVFAPGLDLSNLEERVVGLDERIGSHVDYAFDERFGFLTSCPTNTGTGLRVSVLLHLHALSFRTAGGRSVEQGIMKVHNAAQQLGLAVRGMHGESSRAEGDFFQISNQVTLGRAPECTIEDVKNLVRLVLDWERRNRDSHITENRARLEDHVWRALALLTHARRMSSSEALGHLSALRMGIYLELLDPVVDIPTIQSLMVTLRPGHLQLGSERELSPDERDVVRAELIRDTLGRS